MTRQKAAKICQSIKFILDNEDYSEEVEEALNMAIAALKQLSLPKIIIRQGEQEPCDKRTNKHTETHACDYISRQAAIDALAKEMPSLTTPDGSGEFDHDIQITDEAFVDCMQIINELPSAHPFTSEQIQTMQELESAQIEKAYELGKADRPKWIPCSERLPDTYDDMLVTDGESMAVGSYRDDADAWDNYNFGWLENLSEPPHGIKTVIAWMPLPEIYREDGEKE